MRGYFPPCYLYLHRNIMPLLYVKDFFLYPVRFLDRVECGDDLLALFAAQTLTNLLVVFALKFRPFIKYHTLVVGDTLYLFRVIEAAEINLGSIGYANNLPYSVFELEQAEDAELLGRYLEILIDGLADGCSDLTHDKGVPTIP